MENTYSPGLIFISHSSADKDLVTEIVKRIPKSHLFYDSDTINPGHHTTDELDDGLLRASVFVMFVSPSTPRSVWVQYESGVAVVQKIKRNHLAIVAVPIKGASYRDAPDWMQAYMAVPEGYSNSDIARLIRFRYDEVLKKQETISAQPFVGREDLCNRIIVQSRTKSAQTGLPVNFLIIAGIPNMGRFSVAQNVVPKLYPGSRNDLPVFELPPHGDAIDLFLALREDITGERGKDWVTKQISAFPANPEDQASTLAANLAHFAKINVTVVIKSAYGLRDQAKTLKPWVNALFGLLAAEPNIRVVWISDRLLAPESIETHHNVMQFHVPELAEEQVVFLLTELLDITKSSPAALVKIAPHVHGHPGSAHYVTNLISRSQRAPESLLDKPDSIRLFQEECVQGAISEDAIGGLGRDIIRLLRLLPSADYQLVTAIFSEFPTAEIAQTLWDMTDNCVVNYTMSSGYRLANIVRGADLGPDDSLPLEKIQALAKILLERLKSSESKIAAIDALLFVFVRLKGDVPEEFRSTLTGGTLQEIVEQYYNLGHKFTESWQEHFRTAARVSLLASEVHMSSDTLESILFSGADSLIRVGDDPSPIIDKMQEKKFPSVNYLRGSFYYHRKKDAQAAIPYLQAALDARSYVKRTGRLLAKAYMEVGLPRAGLEVFKKLGERRVNRDTGLLAQKIRCLRACGQHDDANKLVIAMGALENEFGEYEILNAARLMNEGKYDPALEAVAAAALRPKVNRINLRLLETAIKIEKGEFSALDDTCKLAIAIGLDDGARSLRARAAIKQKQWSDAETQLAKITNKNFYDKILLVRALAIKIEDLEIVANPELLRETRNQHDALLLELRRDGTGDWRYDDN